MRIRTQIPEPQHEANQTVRVEIGTAKGTQSMRVSFKDQRLTAYGGLVTWTRFLHEQGVRGLLGRTLPHRPTSPNAYAPADIALGFIGGIVSGADKLSRVAWLQSDRAVAEVLGIEAVPSQSTLSRFFGVCTQGACEGLSRLHGWAARQLPSRREGYTLDLDSTALVHEDGHQAGVRVGFTKQGLKPCHKPLVAALAETPLIANYWLRRGDTHCVNNAAPFLAQTLARLPSQVRVTLLRADSGFCATAFLAAVEHHGLRFIVAQALRRPVQRLCRHHAEAWTATEIPGVSVQETSDPEYPDRRLIVVRQELTERPRAGGKVLLELPGYRFQALLTNLPASTSPLEVWRRYNGRADVENRIKTGLRGHALHGDIKISGEISAGLQLETPNLNFPFPTQPK